jgi:hypothetical protein
MNSKLFFIPGSVPSSKNSRLLTKSGLFIASKSVQKYRKICEQYLLMHKTDFKDALSKANKPLIIGFHFVRATTHRWDFINPCQTIQDLMVKAGWIDDDNVDEMFPVPLSIKGKTWSYDKSNPGVYIAILDSFCEEY